MSPKPLSMYWDESRGLCLFAAGDQLLKGAALNAVQIAQLLHERGLIRQKALA